MRKHHDDDDEDDDVTVAATVVDLSNSSSNSGSEASSLQPQQQATARSRTRRSSPPRRRRPRPLMRRRRLGRTTTASLWSSMMAWALLVLLQSSMRMMIVLGQERPLYTEFSYDTNTSYRTDVCDRFRAVQSGELPFRTSLKDLALVPLLRPASQFHLQEEDGSIDPIDPGMMALLLDELARRAGFTWRDSFGIYYSPGENKTWTDLLLAATQQYDFLADYWGVTASRLEHGVSFPTGYYDSSLILVARKLDVDTKDTVVLFNWLQPFDIRVWFAMLVTILYSALVYSFLEWCGDEHDHRTTREWLADNFYLSSLLFTQNFEFAPKSVATRLFAISMALWALLLTTTYTANLANFFVTKATIQRDVSTIEGAVDRGYKICSWAGTWGEEWAKRRYPTIQLVSKNSPTPKEVYMGLLQDECHFALTSQYTWERFEVDKEVNQNCTLEQVGDKYVESSGSFALFGDHGVYCTSLIGDVLNLHLQELELEGFLQELWADHLYKLNNNFCDGGNVALEDDAAGERRQRQLLKLEEDQLVPNQHGLDRQRRLKAKRNAAAAASAGRFELAESHSLNIKNLAGSFGLHAVLSVLALMLSCCQNVRLERRKQQPEHEKDLQQQPKLLPPLPLPPPPPNESTEVIVPLVPWTIRFDPNRNSAATATTNTTQTLLPADYDKKVSVEEALQLLDNMHKELQAKVSKVSTVIQALGHPNLIPTEEADDTDNEQIEDDSVSSFADEHDTFHTEPIPTKTTLKSVLRRSTSSPRRRVSFSDQKPPTVFIGESDEEVSV